MNALLLAQSTWVSSVPAVAADVAVKGTALLVVGLLTHVMLGRRRVLGRSAVWNACVAALLLLPLATIALPRWRVHCLPASLVPTASEERSESNGIEGPDSSLRYVETDLDDADSIKGDSTGELEPPATDEATLWPPGTASDRSELPISAPSTVLAPTGDAGIIAAQAPASERSETTRRLVAWLWPILAGLYLAGLLLGLLRLAWGLRVIHRHRRSCVDVDDPVWLVALRRARQRLDIHRPVRLAWSTEVTVPIAFGWREAAVLLPCGLATPAQARHADAILLHELAHIRRNDFAWQVLLSLARAMYWPHPLIWAIAKLIPATREQAIDALCVYHSREAGDYSETLLEVARGITARPAAALGLAMARTPQIVHRLQRIAAGYRVAHCQLGRSGRTMLLAIALLVAGLTGALRLAPRVVAQATEQPATQPAVSPPSIVQPADSSAGTTQPSEAQPAEERTVDPSTMRYFVTLVVGPDGLTFNGEPTTWEELPERMNEIPNRPYTVLEVAMASADMSIRQQDEALARASMLARAPGLDFEYTSDVGIHPLGTKATVPPQPRPAGTPPAPATQPVNRLKAGQVIERKLRPDFAGDDTVLDLDTGKLYSTRDLKGDFPTLFAERGIDVGASMESIAPGLYGFDIAVMPVANEAWDQAFWTTAQGAQMLSYLLTAKPATPAPMLALGDLPRTYLFRTREDGVGILQITGMEKDNDPHFAIRYKLLPSYAEMAQQFRESQASPRPVRRLPATQATTAPERRSESTTPAGSILIPPPVAANLNAGKVVGLAVAATRSATGENEPFEQFVAFLGRHSAEDSQRQGFNLQWWPLAEGVQAASPEYVTAQRDGRTYILLRAEGGAALVAETGGDRRGVLNAEVVKDAMERSAVRFELDEAAGREMERITSGNIGKPLAMIVGGQVRSIAIIRSTLGRQGQVTGNFSEAEAQRLADMMRGAGSPERRPESAPAENPGMQPG